MVNVIVSRIGETLVVRFKWATDNGVDAVEISKRMNTAKEEILFKEKISELAGHEVQLPMNQRCFNRGYPVKKARSIWCMFVSLGLRKNNFGNLN